MIAAAGDGGYDNTKRGYDAPLWPAVSPDVISVGGTVLDRVENPKEGERGWEEKVWPETGSGCSLYESEPTWQEAKTFPKACGANRTDNDVASVAEEVSVYSTPIYGGWLNAGGTSASAPFIAGVEAHATSPTKKLGADAFYRKQSMFFHISYGGNGVCTPPAEHEYLCRATKEGYNGPAGWGTPDGVFTSTAAPSAATGSATSVTETGATLNGTVNPNNVETKYYFEYGTTESYGSKTAEASAGSGESSVEESKAVTGLTLGTTYDFRIVATNSEGTTHGGNQKVTPSGKPAVETKAATSLSTIAATLNGSVNPRAAETKYDFEYGTTESYGSKTAEASAGLGTSSVEESKTLTGLTAGKTYDFRIVATNSHGTTDGENKAFTTTSWSAQEPPRPTGAVLSDLDGGVSCTSSTACIAAGAFENSSGKYVPLAERWNGTSWTVQEPPISAGAKASFLHDLSCTASMACIATGYFENSSGTYVPLAESWNGTSWTVQEPPSPTGALLGILEEVSCTSSTTCTAVGWFINSSEKGVPLAESWNGTSWSVQESPNPTGAKKSLLDGVSCTASTACVATGYFENSSGKELPLAESWNGTSWSVQEPPSPTAAENSFLVGNPSCTSATACIATGYFKNSSEKDVALAESWNGTSWTVEEPTSPTGAKQNILQGVACTSATACVATGFFDDSEGKWVPLAELYQ